ncbi:MAG: tRNA uridine-5-carboxymethylaminomethyl(34) synthesis GTPase MnmE [Caulobacterales bacterium]|nr:tRNA uridine-5-carboxymethylaminomethyl(34) synthesis GTPase MnmE [Caulobacterales bacterium]MCA0371877.1 tRNA uridine-5-carboxymethylaminomethyl(34) synthesis GTPase MnmE [Pseudomonadota bacterium]
MTSIIAPASGTAKSGVIVIRVSGNNSKKLIETLSAKACPKPRFASLRQIFDNDGNIIDNALVLFFEGPNSFTGEDVAEFHIHGGPSVLAAFMSAALKTNFVELAKPGEFSKRAFRNGKMDLTQAEGLADLIDAETEAQRKQAIRQMRGDLKNQAHIWRNEIVDCLAEAEAYIDFPDEDLPSGLSNTNRNRISKLSTSLKQHLDRSKSAQKIRDGLNIIIIGAPNVGKSSFLNAICGREAAIVSSIAGTTRDIVEVSFILKNNLISLADTAGLREANDIIEQEGIKRALEKAKDADLIFGLASNKEEAEFIKPHLNDGDYLIWSKSDARDSKLIGSIELKDTISEIEISSQNPDDIYTIEEIIIQKCVTTSENLEIAPLTRIRHYNAIERTISHLDNALMIDDDNPEIACEELRMSARALGEFVGIVGIEDIYDRIFSSFCIGK